MFSFIKRLVLEEFRLYIYNIYGELVRDFVLMRLFVLKKSSCMCYIYSLDRFFFNFYKVYNFMVRIFLK